MESDHNLGNRRGVNNNRVCWSLSVYLLLMPLSNTLIFASKIESQKNRQVPHLTFQVDVYKPHAPLIPNMCRTVQSIFFTVLASNVKFALLGVPVASELVRLTTRRGDFKIYWSLNMPSSPSSIGFNYSHKLTITAAYNSATAVTAQQCLGNKWLVHF